MSTQTVDDNRVIWFFSGYDSQHIQEIGVDNWVQPEFMLNTNDYAYLTVFGTAEVLHDQVKNR